MHAKADRKTLSLRRMHPSIIHASDHRLCPSESQRIRLRPSESQSLNGVLALAAVARRVAAVVIFARVQMVRRVFTNNNNNNNNNKNGRQQGGVRKGEIQQ